MRKLLLPCLLFLLLIVSFQGTNSQSQETPWNESCSTNDSRHYLNSKYITKGVYANKNPDAELLADIWLKIVPRRDTEQGRTVYQEHLKQLKKKVKDKSQAFAYQMAKISFHCESRRVNVWEMWDYDSDGNILYKWPKTWPGLSTTLYGDTVGPGTANECLLDIVCEVLKAKDSSLKEKR
ncbi:MAG TPA: hypothetical protein VK582_18835 [Pyrinomonadaceae bacterium]|nr:hypothetical protein [Pyrinomonadaceae bacterium]